MMTSLFTVFDPSSSVLSNWFIICLMIFFIPSNKWFINHKSLYLLNQFILTLNKELKLLMNSFIPGISLMFISLLIFILLSNFTGLFPFVFTSTSHITVSLSLSLLMWLSFNWFGWTNNPKHMMAHLVPSGTPASLMNFMVCIETISSVIRPLTLSIRLSANMIAGHLLLTLLANTSVNSSYMVSSLIIFSQILLLTLETAVAFIQSYVFSVLSFLYASEVN